MQFRQIKTFQTHQGLPINLPPPPLVSSNSHSQLQFRRERINAVNTFNYLQSLPKSSQALYDLKEIANTPTNINTPITFNQNTPFKLRTKKTNRPTSRDGSRGSEQISDKKVFFNTKKYSGEKLQDFCQTTSTVIHNFNSLPSDHYESSRTECSPQKMYNFGRPKEENTIEITKITQFPTHNKQIYNQLPGKPKPLSKGNSHQQIYYQKIESGRPIQTDNHYLLLEIKQQRDTIQNFQNQIVRLNGELRQFRNFQQQSRKKPEDKLQIGRIEWQNEQNSKLLLEIQKMELELKGKNQLNTYLEQQCKIYIEKYDINMKELTQLKEECQKQTEQHERLSIMQRKQIYDLNQIVAKEKAQNLTLSQTTSKTNLMEINRLNRLVEAQSSKLEQQQKNIQVDRSEINLLMMKLQTFQTKNQQLTLTISELEQIIRVQNEQIQKEQSECNKKITEVKHESKQWAEKLNKSNQQINSLINQKQSFKNQIQNLHIIIENELKELKIQVEQKQFIIKNKESLVKEKEQVINNMEKNLNQKQKKNIVLLQNLKQKSIELNSKIDYIKDIQKKLKQNQNQICLKVEYIKDIQKNIQYAKQKQKQLLSTGNHFKNIQKKVKQTQNQILSKSQYINKIQKRLKDIENQLLQKGDYIIKIQTSLKETQNQLLSKGNYLKDTQNKLKQKDNQLLSQQKYIKEIQNKLRSKESQLNSKVDMMRGFQKRFKEKQNQSLLQGEYIKEMQKRLKLKQNQLISKEEHIKCIQKQMATQLTIINSNQIKLKTQQQEKQRIQKLLQSNNTFMSTKEEDIKNHERIILAKNSYISNLQKIIKQRQQQMSILQQKLQQQIELRQVHIKNKQNIIKSQTESLNSFQNKFKEKQRQVFQLNKQLQQFNKVSEKLLIKIGKSEQQLKSVMTTTINTQDLLANYRGENSQLKSKINELQIKFSVDAKNIEQLRLLLQKKENQCQLNLKKLQQSEVRIMKFQHQLRQKQAIISKSQKQLLIRNNGNIQFTSFKKQSEQEIQRLKCIIEQNTQCLNLIEKQRQQQKLYLNSVLKINHQNKDQLTKRQIDLENKLLRQKKQEIQKLEEQIYINTTKITQYEALVEKIQKQFDLSLQKKKDQYQNTLTFKQKQYETLIQKKQKQFDQTLLNKEKQYQISLNSKQKEFQSMQTQLNNIKLCLSQLQKAKDSIILQNNEKPEELSPKKSVISQITNTQAILSPSQQTMSDQSELTDYIEVDRAGLMYIGQMINAQLEQGNFINIIIQTLEKRITEWQYCRKFAAFYQELLQMFSIPEDQTCNEILLGQIKSIRDNIAYLIERIREEEGKMETVFRHNQRLAQQMNLHRLKISELKQSNNQLTDLNQQLNLLLMTLNAKMSNHKYQTKMAMALIKQKIPLEETSIMMTQKFFTTTSFKEEEEAKLVEGSEMGQTKQV